MKPRRRYSCPLPARGAGRAAVLIVVLWTVVILSIVVANFSFLSRTHLRLSGNYGDLNTLRNAAAAGIELAIAVVRDDDTDADTLQDAWLGNRREFQDFPVGDGTVSLVRSSLDASAEPGWGLEDEAAKLNLRTASAEQILKLPGMTQELVDALLDWTDADDTPRPYGAESDFYELLPKPYPCRNAPLASIAELLLVRGFDRAILYGEDADGDGRLDPNEDDGSLTVPDDNADGRLDPGLLPYVTIYSSDREVAADGTDRVDISQATAEDLQATIPGLSADDAQAIIAYRERNPFEQVGQIIHVTKPQPQQPGQPPQPEPPRPDGADGNQPGEEAPSGGEGSAESGRGEGPGNERPPGAAPGQPPQGDQQQQGEPLFTPQRGREILDYCKVGQAESTPGRINVNTAPETVLRTLPRVSEELARAIVDQRRATPGGFASVGDLLDVPGMDRDVFLALSGLVTVRSWQFSAHAVARLEEARAMRHVVAVLNRGNEKVTTLYWNEY